MNYYDRDTYGMYKSPSIVPGLSERGPGPQLMGADTLIGGDGADTFEFDNLDMADVVTDFDSAEMDKIDFGGALAQFDNTDVAAYMAPPAPVPETDPVNKFDMTDGKVYLVDVDFTDFAS